MTTKFRAWLIKEKKMVGVIDLLLAGGGIIQTSCEDSDYDGLSKVVGRDCALMQFTGLKDKNGKEIYEGDILESDNENFATGVVVYDDGRFAIKKPNGKIISYDHTIWTAYEVIGNIYENPELLEEKQ